MTHSGFWKRKRACGYAELTEIRRQTDARIQEGRRGNIAGHGKAAQKGFDALDKMGCVIEATARSATACSSPIT